MELDKKDLMKIVRTFNKGELNKTLGHHQQAKCIPKEKQSQIEKLLDNENLRQKLVDRIMEIQGQKCPIDKKDDAQVTNLAKRITNDLDADNPSADYDNEGRMMAPDVDGMKLFERFLKAACNGKLNPITDRRVYNKGWSSLGNDGQQRWKSTQKKLAELYTQYLIKDGQIADKLTRSNFDTGKGKVSCPYCFCIRDMFYTLHILRHFPLNKVSANIKKEMDDVIGAIKSDSDFSKKLHERVLAFHLMLYSNNKSDEELNLLNEIEQLYEQMMSGDSDHKLYFLTQLIDGYEALPKNQLAKAVFRYNGKAAHTIRHFNSFNYGVGGNVGREISLIIKSHIARESGNVQESDKLYAWEAIKVPAKSAAVLEQSITSALWHLNERGSNYWNMQMTALKSDDPFAQIHPETLIYVGLYAIYLVIDSFSAQAVKQKSQELLTTYDAFSKNERQKFNSKYKIDVGDERDSQIAVLMKTLQDFHLTVKSKAEAQSNDEILQICNQPQVMALLTSNQAELTEAGDFEDDASSKE